MKTTVTINTEGKIEKEKKTMWQLQKEDNYNNNNNQVLVPKFFLSKKKKKMS